MKIEMHLLQNFAPSCLNRDDTNAPKECEFGGVRRARVSSQCLKRAARLYFKDNPELLGISVADRTKRLKEKLTARLQTTHPDAADLAARLDVFLASYYSKMDSKNPDLTAVLVYLGEREVDAAAKAVNALWRKLEEPARKTMKNAEKAAKKHEGRSNEDGSEEEAAKGKVETIKVDAEIQESLIEAARCPDVGLFGRMLAEQPKMNVDAACQVAHAVSTHRVGQSMDFYTAVDDLNPEATTGAGMMGYIGFNSACFYRYSLLDLEQLCENLQDADLAKRVTAAFLRAVTFAIPTGKKTWTAPYSVPSFGLFVVRDGGVPCSLANAFAEPVRVDALGDQDLVGRSIAALDRYWGEVTKVYGQKGIVSMALFQVGHAERLEALKPADKGSFEAALRVTMDRVCRYEWEKK